MNKHNGNVVESRVRRSGYNLTNLACALKVSRRTVYNLFHNRFLKAEIIFKIGNIIGHDFSKEFPEYLSQLKPPTDNIDHDDHNLVWKTKYIDLLERYNEVLLSRISHRATG